MIALTSGFGRRERIRQRAEFEAVYARGTKVVGRYMLMFVLPSAGSSPRFGVAATKKLGSAVERNRAKRLARELFRAHKPTGGLDIVIVARREMLSAPFAVLESDYRSLLERRDRPRRAPTISRVPRHPGRA